ncbi:hypothetical protein [Circoviridae sp.]|nr:hypothetical protein [Circoviridae sp.]
MTLTNDNGPNRVSYLKGGALSTGFGLLDGLEDGFGLGFGLGSGNTRPSFPCGLRNGSCFVGLSFVGLGR